MTTIDPDAGVAGAAWASRRGDGTWSGTRSIAGHRFSFALWDSRRVALRLVPGRVDPGGTGALPAALWDRQIAAFNGGFRSVHGHYGLRAEGRTFLPARAGLATLALALDGSWWLGTLPAGTTLEGAEAYRQNLAPLFAEGRFDPSARGSFGAVAPGKTGDRTTRTALGLRDDGLFVYVHGIDVTPAELAAATQAAGATYAMALDMNDGQAGFEWLEIGAAASGHSLASHDAGKAVWNGTAGGHRIRAERLSVPMGTPLPRWLSGDPRDYFVLLRSVEPLPEAHAGDLSGFDAARPARGPREN